jgi:hypothetical protein
LFAAFCHVFKCVPAEPRRGSTILVEGLRDMKTIHGLMMASVALCASAVSAQNIVINIGAYSAGNGGEFNATVTNTTLSFIGLTESGSFETFCLERSENLQPGATYFFDVSTSARAGGGGASGGVDPLDERTAHLYSAFISGVLPNYDYDNSGNDREEDAGALQRAIWFLENEVDSLNSAKAVAFYNYAQGGDGLGLGNVVVLNVYSIDDQGDRVERQSQIAMIPTPGSFALAGLGTLAAFRRRR